MRGLPLHIGVLIGMSACQEQRSFEERHTNAQSEIERRAAELDSELNKASPDKDTPRS